MKKSCILILLCLLASAAITFAAPAPVFQLRLVLENPSPDSEQMTNIIHREHRVSNSVVLNVQKTVLLDQTELKSAKPAKDSLNQPIIEITLIDAGAKKFAEITRQNIHHRLAIVIDGQLLSAPVIQSEIPGGKIQISGHFTEQEAKDLAKKINAASGKK